MYSDDYPTCEETYATLRIYPGEFDPDEVTRRLGIDPTEVQRVGERHGRTTRKTNGWFLRSQDRVESRDARRHIDWLLDQLEPAANALSELRASGAEVDISCYWLSASGHGGPSVSPRQTKRLSALDLDCWFDVYFNE